MSLRVQITLVLVLIISLLAAGLVWQQMRTIRTSLAEEIETAGAIGTQVLSRVNEIYQDQGSRPMKKFLTRLGRLRAHDIILLNEYGEVIYRSPASTYLRDQEVPAWFLKMVSPESNEKIFTLSNGRLLVRTDASRAIAEGWGDFRVLLITMAIGFVMLNLFAYWLVSRAMAPFTRVTGALRAVQKGDYETRLPVLPGAEANALGETFNSMVDSVQESIEAREAAAKATAELAKNRELTKVIQQRIEHEHTSLAQELHDELGQHVTAIKSLGISIKRRISTSDESVAQAAELVVDSADRIHAAMRQMLTRLRPASLDQFGLGDAMTDMISDWQIKHPEKKFMLDTGHNLNDIQPLVATAAYRIAQESVTNAIRHSGASEIRISLHPNSGTLRLNVRDNGRGLDGNLPSAGFGLTGMMERTEALGGKLDIGVASNGGVSVTADLPMEQEAERLTGTL